MEYLSNLLNQIIIKSFYKKYNTEFEIEYKSYIFVNYI